MSEVLSVDAPWDLNLLWWIGHAGGWCPYGGTRCAGADEPAGEWLREACDAPLLGAVPAVARRLWEARMEVRAVSGVDRDAEWTPDPSLGLEPAVDRFRRQWSWLLGPKAALEALWRNERPGEFSLEEWCRRTPVRTLELVGTEDALMRRGAVAIAGATAARSRARLLDLLSAL